MAIYTTVREKLESIQKSKKESDIFPTLQMLFKLKDFQMLRLHMEIQKWEKTWFSSIMTLC